MAIWCPAFVVAMIFETNTPLADVRGRLPHPSAHIARLSRLKPDPCWNYSDRSREQLQATMDRRALIEVNRVQGVASLQECKAMTFHSVPRQRHAP